MVFILRTHAQSENNWQKYGLIRFTYISTHICARPLHYALITYHGARVSSCYVCVSRLMVRVSLRVLGERPLYPIRTASSRRSFYGNSWLTA